MSGDFETYSFDGSYNNPIHAYWGTANSPLLDNVPLAYADGYSTPAGGDRPNPREISNALSQQEENIYDPRGLTNFIWAWGQFLDHDLDLTPELSYEEAAEQDRFISIAVPPGDRYLDPLGTDSVSIEMRDAAYIQETGTDPNNPRQLPNIVTSWMDGSQVYGSSRERADALRTFTGGRMLVSEGDLLPLNATGLENDNPTRRSPEILFVAGDVRANENAVLSSMHALFVREHNRLAQELAADYPDWTDEQLYQRARQVNIAQIQSITYNEYLPTLLGIDALPDYGGYDPTVNPGISRIFSTAAFRLGHTQLSTEIARLDNEGNVISEGNLTLAESFFPSSGALQEAGIDPILRGLAGLPSQQVDTLAIDDVRNLLFGFGPAASARDLIAVNIQRGRANGLADYNAVRAAFGLERVQDFTEITKDLDKQSALESLYGTVDDIDAFIGMLAEDLRPGASVGETIEAVLVDQFGRLRAGDRFYYENHFSPSEIATLEIVRLSDIILRNTDTQSLQGNVFHLGDLKLDVSVIPRPDRSILDLTEMLGKPQTLTFTYTGGNLLRAAQEPDKAYTWGTPDDDPNAYVVVADKEKSKDILQGKARIYFAGEVSWGEEFAADAAIAREKKFTSETFLSLYEDAAAYLRGDDPLQVAEYDTSGSQPICRGDVLGSFTLTGYGGKNGNVESPPPDPAIATTAEVMTAMADAPMLVTYQVTNPGQLSLKAIEFESGLTRPYWMGGDANGNALLDPGETWKYTALETALLGQQQVEVGVKAIATANSGAPLGLPVLEVSDFLQYEGIQVPPAGDLSQLYGKAAALTFKYVATNAVLTGGKGNNQNGRAKIESGFADGDPSAYIVVSQSDDVADIRKGTKPLYFAGTVEVGQSFSASLDFAKEGKFEHDTRFLIFEDEAAFLAGAAPLQISRYKTDGSQPMTIGDLVGGVELVEYLGTNGGYDDPDTDPLAGKIGSGFSAVGLFGDARELTFRYDVGTDVLTGGKDGNQDGKATILDTRILDGDGTSFIRVSDKSKPNDLSGKEYFEGTVSLGEEFTASAAAPGANTNKIGNALYIHYFDDFGGSYLGSVSYKTDGSQVVQLGDRLAGATLVGFEGSQGEAFL